MRDTTSRPPILPALTALAFAAACTACTVGTDDSMNSFGTGGPGGPGTGDPGDGDTGGDGSDGGGDTSGDDGTGGTGDPGDTGMPPLDLGDDGTDGGGDTGPDPDPGIESCSIFGDAQGLFDFVNQARADYAGEGIYLPHPRYKGIPWQGEGHDNWTFDNKMAWDEDLAALARAEAQALASGANPDGTKVNGQGYLHNPMWIADINTANWKITVTEDLDDWHKDPQNPFSSDVPFALDKSNGAAREGLHYHDFGGDGPPIHRLGVGGALGEGPGGECQVWWVLQFGD